MNYHKKKRRMQKKALGRVNKTQKQLLKAIKSVNNSRLGLFDNPRIKRAMKKHDEALRMDDWKKADRKRSARRRKRK